MNANDFWLIKTANCTNKWAQSVYNWTTVACTVVREDGVSPVGRSTLLAEDTVLQYHYAYIIPNNPTAPYRQNTAITHEAYVKAVNRTKAFIQIQPLTRATLETAVFDLALGVIHSAPSVAGVHAFMERFKDTDWWRIGITGDGNYIGDGLGTSSVYIAVGSADDSGDIQYTGTGVDAIRIWKAMAYQGDARHPFYQDDYSDSNGVIETGITEAIKFFPEWSSDDSAGKIQTSHGTTQGRKTVYKYGEYNYFKFDVRMMSLQEALMVNRWWKDKDEIVLLDGLTHKTYSCVLMGSRQPMDRVNDTYLNQMSGVLEVEVLNEIFPY